MAVISTSADPKAMQRVLTSGLKRNNCEPFYLRLENGIAIWIYLYFLEGRWHE
jgi:hypothetical protein